MVSSLVIKHRIFGFLSQESCWFFELQNHCHSVRNLWTCNFCMCLSPCVYNIWVPWLHAVVTAYIGLRTIIQLCWSLFLAQFLVHFMALIYNSFVLATKLSLIVEITILGSCRIWYVTCIIADILIKLVAGVEFPFLSWRASPSWLFTISNVCTYHSWEFDIIVIIMLFTLLLLSSSYAENKIF